MVVVVIRHPGGNVAHIHHWCRGWSVMMMMMMMRVRCPRRRIILPAVAAVAVAVVADRRHSRSSCDEMATLAVIPYCCYYLIFDLSCYLLTTIAIAY